MHQSHLGVVGVVALQVAQMPCNGVDQRTGEVASTGMNHHASLLVHHHYVLVFVNYVDGQVLSHDACVVTGTVQHERHYVAGAHLVVALHWAVVDMHEA